MRYRVTELDETTGTPRELFVEAENAGEALDWTRGKGLRVQAVIPEAADGTSFSAALEPSPLTERDLQRPGLRTFDRVCAAFAFVLGVVFILLGALGLFTGCSGNFTLPPILGVLPAVVGWGIVKSVRVAWRR